MSNKIFVIYKITNKINGKCYIGFSSNITHRLKSHIKAAKEGKGFTFHKALRNYGIENFTWEIVEQSENGFQLLSEREPFYIKFYHSHISENGYNVTYGGENERFSKYLNKIYENQNNNPCPKCSNPMERKKHPKGWKPKPGQPYYFSYWDYCKNCRFIKHYESAKRFLNQSSLGR
jgi:group I intron endonuclease